MRSGTHERHLATKYIYELGKLVDARDAQYTANASYATVVPPGLANFMTVFQNVHRAELVDGKLAAVKPFAPLAKDDRPG